MRRRRRRRCARSARPRPAARRALDLDRRAVRRDARKPPGPGERAGRASSARPPRSPSAIMSTIRTGSPGTRRTARRRTRARRRAAVVDDGRGCSPRRRRPSRRPSRRRRGARWRLRSPRCLALTSFVAGHARRLTHHWAAYQASIGCPRHAVAERASARSAAASACSPASGGCACRCRGPASRTATRGRWPPATASCSSTPGCTSRARSPTSSGRWPRSTCGSSTSGCSSARTRTPTTTARRRRSSTRAGCELWMHPNHEHMTRSAADPEAALRGRIEVARQSGVPEEPLRRYAERARARATGSPGSSSPTATCCPGVEIETDLGRWDGPRDAGPRALARLPVPARAPAADLRRPPARPRLALLRLRLDARPRRRVPALARRRRGARRAPVPVGPRPHVHRRPGPHRRPTASWSPSASPRSTEVIARRPADRLRRRPARLRRGDHAR